MERPKSRIITYGLRLGFIDLVSRYLKESFCVCSDESWILRRNLPTMKNGEMILNPAVGIQEKKENHRWTQMNTDTKELQKERMSPRK